MEKCPCGSEKLYIECCEPLITNKYEAKTARELLQSRYTAYCKKNVAYITKTAMIDKSREAMDEESIKKWAEKTEWLRLEIIDCQKGSIDDDSGTVEFIAWYKERDKNDCNTIAEHHEIAQFIKQQNKWYYKNSEFPKPKQILRDAPKINRNDPCSCKSGKKYKKCCGLNK